MTSFPDQPAGQFLDDVAARTPAPGGGGASAMTAALAAGLVAMAARFSQAQLPGAAEIASRADELRHRATELVTEDGEAYGCVLEAFALPRDAAGDRDERIRAALERAAAVPGEMTQIAAQVAGMAARLAAEGNPNLRGDSISAALLAEAAARSAAALVAINVGLGSLSPGLSQAAAQNVAAARDAAQQAATAV